MIRKAVIAICLLAAAATFTLAVVSSGRGVDWDLSREPAVPLEEVRRTTFLTNLPASVKQHWAYLHLADSHATLSYCSRDVPPFLALDSRWYALMHRQYLAKRGLLHAQWWLSHPEVFRGPAKHDGLRQEYLEQLGNVRASAALLLTWLSADQSLLFRYTRSPHLQLVVRFPLIWPGVLLLVYPAVALARGPLRHYLRRRKGLCINCGYDLTGNVTGVCPECGEAI